MLDLTKVVIVAGFLAALFALQVVFRKYGKRLGQQLGQGRRIRVLESTALGPQERLTLIEAEGQRLLVLSGRRGQGAFWPLEGAAPDEAQP